MLFVVGLQDSGTIAKKASEGGHVVLKPIIPFEPIAVNQIPTGENWVAQIKWDGVRILSYCEGGEVRLINRRQNDRTMQYPELQDPKAYCSASSFILDGEMIALDSSRPSFHEIMKRDSVRREQSVRLATKQTPVTYMVFDVLYVDGEWVHERTLAQRQQLLRDIIIPQAYIQIVQNFTDGQALYDVMLKHEMEGIVCKDLNSTYVCDGKDKRWQKKKIFRDLYAVIGGVTLQHGVANALLLGLYNDTGALLYIGHAGTGTFSRKGWEELTERLRPLIIERSPFSNEPKRSRDALWVKPEIVVKVEYMEWTPGHTMRHPTLQGIVEMSKEECTLMQI